MAIPQWATPVGSLGTIQESKYYTANVVATDADMDPLTYTLQAGSLPNGLRLLSDGTIAGIPFALDLGTESKFAIRVTDGQNINERTFSLLVEGQDDPVYTTNPGLILTIFDCTKVNQQILSVDLDPGDTITYKLVAGELPPGLSLDETGIISGVVDKILPLNIILNSVDPVTAESKFDNAAFDVGGFDFNSKGQSREFVFTTEITDGQVFVTQDNSIFVNSNDELTADNNNLTSDNAVLTADLTVRRTPLVITNPGSVGLERHENYWAFQIVGLDCDGEALTWELQAGSVLPDGITLNTVTGWLTGILPSVGVTQTDYNFAVRVFKTNNTEFISTWTNFVLTVKGDLETGIMWLTDADLGTVSTGDVSQLFVEAEAADFISLIYEFDSSFGIKSGSLPQGVIVQQDGTIEGRFSFRTFGLDQKTTTFDAGVTETTIDKTHKFDVTVRDTNGYIDVKKAFTVKVIDKNYEPYENLSFIASNSSADRTLFNNFINDVSIFEQDKIYRPFDWNHGVQNDLRMLLISGLKAESTEKFLSNMAQNFYRKKILFGDLKIAQAINSLGNIVYEVIYIEVNDQMVNADGISQNNVIQLSNSINADLVINNTNINIDNGIITVDQDDFQQIWSNSFENMRNKMNANIAFTLEQAGSLPLWMRSEQTNGKILNWVPAIPICFCAPGNANEILFNIVESGFNFQNLNFEINKLEWDNNLSSSFNKTTRKFSVSNMTTFDREAGGPGLFGTAETTWDENNARWISNVDTYVVDNTGDEFLGFPRQNLFR